MELRRSLQLTVRALALSQRISLVKMSAAASSAASLSYKSSEERLAHLVENPNEILILDGGTGEELFVRGVPDDRKIWSATAVVHDKYHATLVEVHKSFLRAGAQAVTTNSYGVTPGVGFDTDEIKKYCSCAGKLARQAVSEEPGNALVLGSLGPLVESYRADLVMEHDAGAAVYKSMVASLAPFVDCFLGETMSSVEETMQVVDAVASMSSDTRKPCLVSYSLDSDGNLRSGEPPVQAIPRILAYSEAHCVKVFGILFNCSTPEAITRAFQQIRNDPALTQRLVASKIRLGAYANRLTPVASDWTMEGSNGPQPFRDDVAPQQYYDDFVHEWVHELKTSIVGGCCGITPDHIALISSKLHPGGSK